MGDGEEGVKLSGKIPAKKSPQYPVLSLLRSSASGQIQISCVGNIFNSKQSTYPTANDKARKFLEEKTYKNDFWAML